MSEKLKVSIVTPTLNSKEYIEQTIQSVRAQTYTDIEHVIIDGCSTDGTLEILKRHESHIVLISEPDKGTSDATNKGIMAATGDIILFLGSDDYLIDDTVIEEVMEYFNSDPDLSIVYGKIVMLDESTGYFHINGREVTLEDLKKETCPFPAFFAKKKLYIENNMLDLRYRIANDYDFVIRCFKTAGVKTKFFDRIISAFRLGGMSNNIKSLSRCNEETRDVVKRHFGVNIDELRDMEISTIELYRMWLEQILLGNKPLTGMLKQRGVKNAIVFGTGKLGIYIYADLIKSGIDVIAFIDSNKERQQFRLKDIPINSIEWLSDNAIGADVIIVAVEGGHDGQLQQLITQTVKGQTEVLRWKELFYGIED